MSELPCMTSISDHMCLITILRPTYALGLQLGGGLPLLIGVDLTLTLSHWHPSVSQKDAAVPLLQPQ